MIADLRDLIRSSNSLSRFCPPSWDLNVILHHLTSEDYEPLEVKDFEHVSLKTPFLLLESARYMPWTSKQFVVRCKLHLGLCWSFISKYQLPSHPWPPCYNLRIVSTSPCGRFTALGIYLQASSPLIPEE